MLNWDPTRGHRDVIAVTEAGKYGSFFQLPNRENNMILKLNAIPISSPPRLMCLCVSLCCQVCWKAQWTRRPWRWLLWAPVSWPWCVAVRCPVHSPWRWLCMCLSTLLQTVRTEHQRCPTPTMHFAPLAGQMSSMYVLQPKSYMTGKRQHSGRGLYHLESWVLKETKNCFYSMGEGMIH